MTEEISPDFGEYNTRTAEIWDRLAEWWDDKIGDGNPTQDLLVEHFPGCASTRSHRSWSRECVSGSPRVAS